MRNHSVVSWTVNADSSVDVTVSKNGKNEAKRHFLHSNVNAVAKTVAQFVATENARKVVASA